MITAIAAIAALIVGFILGVAVVSDEDDNWFDDLYDDLKDDNTQDPPVSGPGV